MNTKEKTVIMCKLAENAEQYNDMVKFAKELIESGATLDDEDRNMISVAYKNYVGIRRTSWRMMSELETTFPIDETKKHVMQEYKDKIEKELDDGCREILALIDDHLVKTLVTIESKVFVEKMRGDYHRYIAETKTGELRDFHAGEALKIYTNAYEMASELAPSNIIRLGLALNFSVFFYEIQYSVDKAREMAGSAFKQAIPDLDNISESDTKDTTIILQLIKDNLTLWSATPGQLDEDLEDEEVDAE